MAESAFQRILSNLDAADAGVTEKTASDAAPPAGPDAAQRMLSTVRSVSSALKTGTKTAAPAAATTPLAPELRRMAKEAKDAEAELMEKQAHTMGSAICDGFMERFAQYDAALGALGVKTAQSIPGIPGVTVDSTELEKAAQYGYSKAVEDMEKNAATEYERGYDETLEAVYKTASDIHYVGQQAAHELIQQARKTP